jgi:hypothetical protein
MADSLTLPAPSMIDRAKGFFSNYSSTFLMLAGALVVFGIAYAVYSAFLKTSAGTLSKAKPTFDAYVKVTKLAPIGCPTPADFKLADYYMASSSYSIFPGAEIYDYVSDQILPMVIKAGARLVELDIYSDDQGKPVVGLKNQKLGTDYAYNSVSFEACCVSIANNAFNSVSCPVSSDPFVLSLVFHTDKTNVINACAEILKTTCRQHLLDETYAYQRKNLAVEPICNLQNKLILVSGEPVKGTKMEELINLSWSTSHLRRMTYTQASQPHDPNELIDYNRTHITMVVSDVGSDLVNNNPQILFTYGCQWIMMNYGSIDSMMELYISEFQENSLVLKPKGLLPIAPKKYKQPTLPDPNLSFQPMQKVSPIYNVTI